MTVTFDERGVEHRRGDAIERIAWDELAQITIVTTDEGPFVEDVYYVLADARGTAVEIGQTTPGMEALLGRLQRLPAFDNEAVIAAMLSTDHARFVCWRR